MKKIVKSLLLVMTVFLFAGCSNSSNNQSAGSEGNNGDYSKLRVALIPLEQNSLFFKHMKL